MSAYVCVCALRSSQAKNNSIARQRACDESKNAYAAELQKTNQVQHEHYHSLMPKVFEV